MPNLAQCTTVPIVGAELAPFYANEPHFKKSQIHKHQH